MGRGGHGTTSQHRMSGAMLAPADSGQSSLGGRLRNPASTGSPPLQRRAAWITERQPRARGFLHIPRPIGHVASVSAQSQSSLLIKKAAEQHQAGPSNTTGAVLSPATGTSALTSAHSTRATEAHDRCEDERAQVLAMRRRTRALFSGTGRFSTAPIGDGGRQAQSCARLTAALPVISPPKVPMLQCTVAERDQAHSTPRSTQAEAAASPAVSAPSTPTIATTSSVNSLDSRVRAEAAENMSSPPTGNFLFRAVGAPLNGRQPVQLQSTRSVVATARPVTSGQPWSATIEPLGSRGGHTTKRWRNVHSSGSRNSSSSSGTPESIAMHHKNVAAVSLSTTARRRLESSRMNSRKAIYVLNAVLKRRADAQFEKLAAEKAAEAEAEAEAEEEEEDADADELQVREKEDADGYSTGAEATVNNADTDSKVMRPVQLVLARHPDDDDADAVAGEQTEVSAGAAESEVQRMATQRSLLEGMTAAGVLTNQQCEAAVARLATQKMGCAEQDAGQVAPGDGGQEAKVADRDSGGN